MKKKITIITGGGTGIGRALCLKFVDNGYQVLAVGRRQEKLKEAHSLSGKSKLFHYISADVALERDRSRIAEIASAYSVQYLVHNAAILGKIEYMKDMDIKNWRSVISINLEAPVFLTQSLLPFMENSRILNVSSGAAHNAMKGWGPYCASKSALHMMYNVWNKELEEHNIHVGSVRPGVVDTAMQTDIRNEDKVKFPFLNKFHVYHENNELENTNRVANFIFWILTSTTNDQFIKSEWNIRDKHHQENWDV